MAEPKTQETAQEGPKKSEPGSLQERAFLAALTGLSMRPRKRGSQEEGERTALETALEAQELAQAAVAVLQGKAKAPPSKLEREAAAWFDRNGKPIGKPGEWPSHIRHMHPQAGRE